MNKTKIKRRVKIFSPFYLFTFLLLLSSCGEFWDFGTSNPIDGSEMKLGRKVITMFEGDRYAIPVLFTPEEISNMGVHWMVDNDSVAIMYRDSVWALQEGHTKVYAYSSIDRLRDSCVVVVLPPLSLEEGTYPYDMVICASVDVHGEKLNKDNADKYIVAAYVDDELRGIGELRTDKDIEYMVIRVWSPYPEGDEVRLRCYFRGQARAELFPDQFTFDGERHGTLTKLYPLTLGANAEEYIPDIDEGDDNPLIEVPDTTVVEIYD